MGAACVPVGGQDSAKEDIFGFVGAEMSKAGFRMHLVQVRNTS